MSTVRPVLVQGVGAYVPPRAVANDRIARAIPGWSAERIAEKTAIRERRFLWDFDDERGVAVAPVDPLDGAPATNSDMCEAALRRALASAEVEPAELDALFIVTCTPDQLNFSHDAMVVHRRLGCRPDAFALVVDDGCGGTPYVIDLAQRMIASGTFRTVAIVGSAFTSPLVHRETFTSEVTPAPGRKALNAYLSMYVFGDGAGAVVLQAGTHDDGRGILASVARNAHEELVLRRGGGLLDLPFQRRGTAGDHAFVVDGVQVARTYPVYMRECLEAVLAPHPALRDAVRRYYFHQPNKRVMDRFIADAGLPPDRVPSNVAWYGNTSAAGMLILLAEDVEAGHVTLGGGDLVVIAAVGANVHYGAQLVRL